MSILLLVFLLANLADAARPSRLKSFDTIGLPRVMIAVGPGLENSFDYSSLAIDVTVAIAVSASVAMLVGWATPRR